MISIGNNINGYVVLRKLGHGGMAEVWECVKDGEYYAMKTCEPQDANQKARFQREFRLMRDLDSPYVIRVFDQGELSNGTLYIVEELAERSLYELIQDGVSENDKFNLCMQICEGFSYLHQHGEIHRDIKPLNILINGGVPKIADFGIGRFIDRDTTTITTTMESMGSLGYAAPELYSTNGEFRDAPVTVDIYAIGGVLYYIFSNGDHPISIDNGKIPADLVSIIDRCRMPQPSHRYQSVKEIVKAINVVREIRNTNLTMDRLFREKNNYTSEEWMEKANAIFLQSQGMGEVLQNFQKIAESWTKIRNNIKPFADDIARFIVKTFNDDINYSMQFEDADKIAKIAVLLCPIMDDVTTAVDLFDIALNESIRANRWDAMRVLYNGIIKQWDDQSISPYLSYIRDHKSLFEDIANGIGEIVPQIVRGCFERT